LPQKSAAIQKAHTVQTLKSLWASFYGKNLISIYSGFDTVVSLATRADF